MSCLVPQRCPASHHHIIRQGKAIRAENSNQDRSTTRRNLANTNCYVHEPLHFTYHPKCGGSTTHLQLFLRISFNGHTVDDINSSVYHQINPSRDSQDYVCTDAQARSARSTRSGYLQMDGGADYRTTPAARLPGWGGRPAEAS